jgi:hypothetical protein
MRSSFVIDKIAREAGRPLIVLHRDPDFVRDASKRVGFCRS